MQPSYVLLKRTNYATKWLLSLSFNLDELTECFSEWQSRLSTSLKLTAVEVEDIESNWPRNAKRQWLGSGRGRTKSEPRTGQ